VISAINEVQIDQFDKSRGIRLRSGFTPWSTICSKIGWRLPIRRLIWGYPRDRPEMVAQSTWVKYFLARHQIPYQWLDSRRRLEARALVEHAVKGGRLPLVLFFLDGTQFFNPALYQLGWRTTLPDTTPPVPQRKTGTVPLLHWLLRQCQFEEKHHDI
jgi:hypothetical protein